MIDFNAACWRVSSGRVGDDARREKYRIYCAVRPSIANVLHQHQP